MDLSLSKAHIGKLAIKSFAWLIGARGINQLLSFGITALLARLLSPADYGLMGMVTIITGLLIRFNDFGTGMAVIQNQELKEEQLSSIFWFNVALGILISIVLILSSSLVANFYSEPAILPVLSVMALAFTINGFGIIQEALLRRNLKFNIIVRISTFTTFFSGLLGVVAAFLGFGVWALVIQSISQIFVSDVLYWVASGWSPRFRFSLDDIREIKNFSTGIVGFNFLNYLSRNADYLLIGRFLGAVPLGLYTLAYKIMLVPIGNLTSLANQAMFPVFSKVQSESKWTANTFIRMSYYIAVLTFPLMSFVSIQSREIVLVLFGQKWLESTTVVQILSVVAMFQPITSLSGTLLLSKGYSQWFFRFSLITSSITVIGFIVGLRYGIIGVATSYLVTQLIIFIFAYPFLLRKGEVSYTSLIGKLITPGVSVLGMLLAIVLMKPFLLSFVNPLVHLIITGIIGFCKYTAFLLANSENRREMIKDINLISSSMKT